MCATKTWDQGLDPICSERQAELDQFKVSYHSKGKLTVKGRPGSKPGNRQTIQPGKGKFKIPKCQKQGPNKDGKKKRNKHWRKVTRGKMEKNKTKQKNKRGKTQT